jgi:hypothetical protein
MKNVLISLAALAALSSAAAAEAVATNANRDSDLRDEQSYAGKQLKGAYIGASTDAFAVVNEGQKLTNFQRLMKTSQENDQGSK